MCAAGWTEEEEEEDEIRTNCDFKLLFKVGKGSSVVSGFRMVMVELELFLVFERGARLGFRVLEG